MENNSKDEKIIKHFNPFWTMGGFWIFFGVIVLSATFFIKPTPRVPLIISLIIDIAAALLLILLGAICIWKAKTTDREEKN
jgi:hypothetical protein